MRQRQEGEASSTNGFSVGRSQLSLRRIARRENRVDVDAYRVRHAPRIAPSKRHRYRHATSPFTPSVIVEMGFLSNRDDRALLVGHPDVVARALTDGILKFLDENSAAKIFGQDLLIPTAPLRQGPPPSPTTPP